MSQNLQYNYAYIDIETGKCIDVFTCSYQMPSSMPEYVEIPEHDSVYRDKYYSYTTGLWYEDAEMTIEATGLNP